MRIVAWIRKLLGIRGRLARRPSSRRHGEELFPNLFVRQLEERRVLNGTALTWDDVVHETTFDAGSFADDGIPDAFRVVCEGNAVQVSVNGEEIHAAQLDEVTNITINGSGDDDTLIVDLSGGNPFPGGGIIFNGMQGEDFLLIERGSFAGGIDTVTHRFDRVGEGFINLTLDSSNAGSPSSGLLYSGIESVVDTTAPDHLAFQLGPAAEAVTISDHGDIADGQSLISSSNGTSVTFAAPRVSLLVETGTDIEGDADTVGVDGLDSRFDADLTIEGDAQDTVNFTGATDLDGGDLTVQSGSINVEGSIAGEGSTVKLDAGSDGTLVVAGTIDVSSTGTAQTGGTVHLLGDRVSLAENARVDASGDAAGGEVLIGGDYQGANPRIRNASVTEVAPGAVITADAITTGDGGKVVVWADHLTRFYGHIDATGGAQSGNGGLVEVSGKQFLQFDGAVDTRAPNGETGTLLLDPSDLTIIDASEGPGTQDGNAQTGDDILAADPEVEWQVQVTGGSGIFDGQLFTVSDGVVAITYEFDSGGGVGVGNVAVSFQPTDTADLIASVMATAINASHPFVFAFPSAPDVVTLRGSTVIYVDDPASNFSEGPVNTVDEAVLENLAANANVVLEATGQITIGDLTTDGVLNMAQTAAGSFRITSTGSGGITFADPNDEICTAGGSITLQAQGTGSLSNIGKLTTNGGDVVLQSASSASLAGAIDTGGGQLTVTTAGKLDVDAPISAGGGIAVSGDHTIVISGVSLTTVGGNIEFNNSPVELDGGPVQISTGAGSAGDINIAGAITSPGAANTQNLTLNAGNGTVSVGSVGAGADNALGTLDVTGGPATIVISGDQVTTGDQHYHSDVVITTDVQFVSTGGDITFDGTVRGQDNATDPHNLAVIATGGTVTFSGAVGDQGSVDGIVIDAATLVQDGTITAQGQIDVDVANSLTLDEDLTGGAQTDITVSNDNAILHLTTGTVVISAGPLTVAADKMDLDGSISADGQVVTLRPSKAGEAIDLGSTTDNASDTLELSDGELNAITAASTLRIGSGDAGAITVSADLTGDHAGNLHLISGAEVAAVAGGIGGENNLGITAGGNVTFTDDSTAVDVLAVDAGSNSVTFKEADALFLDDVDGLEGITGGDIELIVTTGDLRVLADSPADNGINATGTVELTVAAVGATLKIASNAQIIGTSGNHTYTADNIQIDGSVDASGQSVTLIAANGGNIDVGTAGTGDFVIDNDELSRIDSSSLTIGDSTTGDIVVEGVDISGTVNAGPITLNATNPGATVTFQGAATNVFRWGLAVNGSGSSTLLSADVHATHGGVTINDHVVVDGTRTISSGVGTPTADKITINGSIEAHNAAGDTLTLDATALALDGDIEVTGNVAGTNELAAFTATGAQIDLQDVQVTGGDISVTGSTAIDLNGTTYQTTASGQISFTGPVVFGQAADNTAVTVKTPGNTGGGDDISFSSTVAGANVDLVVDADDGTGADITFGGAVGTIESLTASGATISLGGDITTGDVADNDVSLTGDVTLTDTTVAINTNQTTNDGHVTITGNVNAATAGGQGVTIDAAGGDVQVAGSGLVGNTAPLRAFVVTSANNVSINDVTTQGTAVGDTIDITASGTITISSELATDGAGPNTATGGIRIHGDVQIESNLTLDTDDGGSGADGAITLVGTSSITSNPAYTFGTTFETGSGDLDFAAATLVSLDFLRVASANDVTLPVLDVGDGAGNGGVALYVSSTGNLTLQGDISTTAEPDAAGQIDLTGVGGVISLADADGTVAISTNVAAGTGELTFVEFVQDGVGGVDGLDGAVSVTMSPDGNHVYAVGVEDDAVVVFSRSATTGALTFVGFVQDGVGGVNGVNGPREVTVSPDGKHVYAAAMNDHAVAVFSRNPSTGALTFVEYQKDGFGGVDGLYGAISVTVSPDGNHVYAAGWDDDAVAVFSRNPTTGALTFVQVLKDGVGGVDGLDQPFRVTLSPDGNHVYAASQYDSAVAVFSRNATSGALTFVQVLKDGVGGVDGLASATCVTVSPDGNHVYAVGYDDDAVAVFSRNATTGALTFEAVVKDGVGGVDGLDGAISVTVSADGNHVYAAGSDEHAVAVFSRDSTTGALTFVEFQEDGVGGVDGLAGAASVTVSPDGNHFYAAGSADDAVAVFTRQAGADAPISIGAAIVDGGSNVALVLDAGTNDVTIAGTVGADANPIGALTVSGNDIAFNADVDATGITATAAQAGGDDDSIIVGNVVLDAHGQNFSFTSDNIDIDPTFTLQSTGGAASASFQGETPNTTIGIGTGAAGALNLSEGELQTVAGGVNGFTNIVIGAANQVGLVTIDDSGGDNTLTLNNTGLVINANGNGGAVSQATTGAISLTNSGSGLTINGSGATTTLSADVVTSGGPIVIDDALLINGAVIIRTSGASDSVNAGLVTITGPIDGANSDGADSLFIDAAKGVVDGDGDAAVTLTGAVEGGAGAQSIAGGDDLEGLSIESIWPTSRSKGTSSPKARTSI